MMFQLIRATGLALALTAVAGADPRPAQPFDLPGYDGRRVTLEALKGNPSVLMFFSTDCPHCQQSTMRLAPVYQALQTIGFKMVGLSLNETDNAGLRSFAERFDAKYPLALSSRKEFSRIAGISVMTRIYYPYILFLDKDGVIQEEHQGTDQAWFKNLEVNFASAVQKLVR